jgi:Arc/MetJ family transcription regulator
MGTRTNIVLDDDLIAEAMERAGVTTKKAAVEAALRAYVRKPDYSGLLALAGSGVIADDYDPKNLFRDVPHVAEPSSALSKRPAAKKRSLPKRW